MNESQGTTAVSSSADCPAHDSGGHATATAADDLLPVELIILDHYARQTRCVVQSLPAVLGRNDQAAVILTDPWVSHEHCKLMQHEGLLIVRDLDSKNGVFLHGARVLEAEVHSGDCLTLGRTEITIRYREPASVATATVAAGDTAPVSAPPRPRRSGGPHTEELLYLRTRERMSSAVDELLELPPFGVPAEAKAAAFMAAVREAIAHHCTNCPPYARWLRRQGFDRGVSIKSAADVPFLPVGIFKRMFLASVPESQFVRVLASSGTSGQTPSRIPLDLATRNRQMKALGAILAHRLARSGGRF